MGIRVSLEMFFYKNRVEVSVWLGLRFDRLGYRFRI